MNAQLSTIAHQPIKKPTKIVVPLAVGLAWGADQDYIYQTKEDGRFALRTVCSPESAVCSVFCGEEMADGSFIAFDILQRLGEKMCNWPLFERLPVLQSFAADYGLQVVTCSANGGELLQRVLSAGGEGVVRKRLDSPWGMPFEACKRLETFTCVVTGFNVGQSVRVSRIVESENVLSVDSENQNVPGVSAAFRLSTINSNTLSTVPCGNVALLGGKCDRVRVGSIIKVEGFGLTRAGQIREPRPCKDSPTSWLIQY